MELFERAIEVTSMVEDLDDNSKLTYMERLVVSVFFAFVSRSVDELVSIDAVGLVHLRLSANEAPGQVHVRCSTWAIRRLFSVSSSGKCQARTGSPPRPPAFAHHLVASPLDKHEKCTCSCSFG